MRGYVVQLGRETAAAGVQLTTLSPGRGRSANWLPATTLPERADAAAAPVDGHECATSSVVNRTSCWSWRRRQGARFSGSAGDPWIGRGHRVGYRLSGKVPRLPGNVHRRISSTSGRLEKGAAARSRT